MGGIFGDAYRGQPLAVLNAQMTVRELLDAAKRSERYQHDFDFHLLTDWVDRLWETLKADRLVVDAAGDEEVIDARLGR